MRPRLLLTINCKFAVDFFARGLHTRTVVARLPLRQLGFLVFSEIVFELIGYRTHRFCETARRLCFPSCMDYGFLVHKRQEFVYQ